MQACRTASGGAQSWFGTRAAKHGGCIQRRAVSVCLSSGERVVPGWPGEGMRGDPRVCRDFWNRGMPGKHTGMRVLSEAVEDTKTHASRRCRRQSKGADAGQTGRCVVRPPVVSSIPTGSSGWGMRLQMEKQGLGWCRRGSGRGAMPRRSAGQKKSTQSHRRQARDWFILSGVLLGMGMRIAGVLVLCDVRAESTRRPCTNDRFLADDIRR